MKKFTLEIEMIRYALEYVVTSPEYPGLVLMGRDLTKLLADVPNAIEKLQEANNGRCPYCKCVIESKETYYDDHEECFSD
jgi:hydroxyacyl-ACP dehydratase HTD2-like protein with hotdog domain